MDQKGSKYVLSDQRTKSHPFSLFQCQILLNNAQDVLWIVNTKPHTEHHKCHINVKYLQERNWKHLHGSQHQRTTSTNEKNGNTIVRNALNEFHLLSPVFFFSSSEKNKTIPVWPIKCQIFHTLHTILWKKSNFITELLLHLPLHGWM